MKPAPPVTRSRRKCGSIDWVTTWAWPEARAGDRLGQLGRANERSDGPGVRPKAVETPGEEVVREVVIEKVGDLELAAEGWDETVHDAERVGPQEVHADRDEVALGLGRLLFEAHHVALGVEFRHPEALGVGDFVQQRAGAPRPVLELPGGVGQRRTEQDVVAEDAAESVVADEVTGEADSVGDSERASLIPVREIEAEMLAVREELDHISDALAADDDHDLPNSHAGQRGDRVIDHRPVEDRQQMLVGDDREREKASGRAAREHETLQRGSSGVLIQSVAGSDRASRAVINEVVA